MKHKLLLISLLLFAYPSLKVHAAFPVKDNRVEIIAQKQQEKPKSKIRGAWFFLAGIICWVWSASIGMRYILSSAPTDMAFIQFLLGAAGVVFLLIAIVKAFN